MLSIFTSFILLLVSNAEIKYFKNFKNGFPFLVITGNITGFQRAHSYFIDKTEAYFNNAELFDAINIDTLTQGMFYINKQECETLAELFKTMSAKEQLGHVYFETDALGDEIEVMISYKEYDDLF